jgi:hypothetical protein
MMLEREINQQTQIVAIPKTNEMGIFDWIWHQMNQDKTHKKSTKFQVLLNGILGLSKNNNNNKWHCM